MTTLTPAEQAGGEPGAQVSGIPAQRTGQALRLLVLGAGTSADSARERAAAAGVEIAQRFSNRVTHVVVDESVGAEDPRVVRARSAGVPVLRVDEVAGLVGPEGATGSDERDSADEAVGAAGAAALAAAMAATETTAAARAAVGDKAAPAAVVDKEGLASAGGAGVGGGGGAGHDGDVGRSALVESAAGLAGVKGHSGSADRVEARVVEASPLESALVFPPLPAEVIRDGASADEAEVGTAAAEVKRWGGAETETADEAGAGGGAAEVGVGASAEAWAEIRARAEDAVRAGVEEQAEAEVRAQGEAASGAGSADGAAGASGMENGEGSGVSGVAVEGGPEIGSEPEPGSGTRPESGCGPEVALAQAADAPMSASATAVSLMWAAVPLVSMGLLTPVSLGYAAYRLRSRRLAAATACYTVAVSIAFAISATHPSASDARTSVASGGVLTACLAASWAGGTIHSFLIRRRVFR